MDNDSALRAISHTNFKRIQGFSTPLVDTLDSKLSEILDLYELHHGKGKGHAPPQTIRAIDPRSDGERFDALNAPDLTHTKLIHASVRGDVIRSPSWNALLEKAVITVAPAVSDFEVLRTMTLANIVEGKKSNEGYHYLSELKLSIQGQSANDAWRATASLALQMNMRIEAKFFWRDKPGAQHPGKSGSFFIERAE
jgi:hypothetical protein